MCNLQTEIADKVQQFSAKQNHSVKHGFSKPCDQHTSDSFYRIVVGPTNLKCQKRHSLRSGESNSMQYVWVKALVFTNTPDNQRASCLVFSVSSYILVLRYCFTQSVWTEANLISALLHFFITLESLDLELCQEAFSRKKSAGKTRIRMHPTTSHFENGIGLDCL